MVISRTPEALHITANGQELKKVEEFMYIGVVVQPPTKQLSLIELRSTA